MIAADLGLRAPVDKPCSPSPRRLRSAVMSPPHHPSPPRLARLRRRWRGFLVLHRRWLVALAVGVAVLAGLDAVDPAPPPTTPVVVAAEDLSGGQVLSADDLAVRRMPAGLLPAGAEADVGALTGRTLSAPVRAGEVITDRRVLGPGLLQAHPGSVAVPVRLPDAEVGRLLRVGDVVDLVATSARGPSTTVADAVPVLALPAPAAPARSLGAGALVVVAVPEERALAVSRAAAAGVVGVLLLG